MSFMDGPPPLFKAWDVHHQWTSRCIEEFFVQGDREAEMGLEFSPLCDRNNTMVPQSQIGRWARLRHWFG